MPEPDQPGPGEAAAAVLGDIAEAVALTARRLFGLPDEPGAA